jgi:TonB-linked SusC/RagA family outer membrane protein
MLTQMKLLAVLLLGMVLCHQTAIAQSSGSISGTVRNEQNEALPGVTVQATGKHMTTTDANGNFTLASLNEGTYEITFSYVGYANYPVSNFNLKAGESRKLDVTLKSKETGLGEVVVTALGIKRKKETLGYATQKIDGAQLNDAPATNFVNGLNGKIAGVNIVSTGALGGSSRITVRGETSLSLDKNAPLYVIDGVPAGNDGVTNSSGAADYGNSSSEINPADIESVNVLKGPAAAALYGSRGANGAIIITTKKGSSRNGIGVSFNSYYSIEKVARLPKFQNKFGQGNNGVYKGSNFGASWSVYPDGVEDSYDESWGPRLDNGTSENQFDSPTTNGYRGADVAINNRGDIIATPWVSHPDNIKDFFSTGRKFYNNVAFAGGNDKGNYRLSLTHMDETSVIPNNDLKRYQISLNSSYNLSKRVTTGININYVKQESENRPDNGYGRNTFMYFFTWMGRNVNMNSLKNYWQPGLEGLRQFQYNYGENHNNPFFMMYENTKGQNKDRIYGNIYLDYAITDHLKLKLRTAQDFYYDFRPMKWAVSTVDYEQGRYEEVNLKYSERNTDFLLTYNNTSKSGIGYNISAGGNRFDQSSSFQSSATPQLLIPGVYNLENAAGVKEVSANRSKKRINSLYALASINYKDYAYLDLTARNDWSSSLPEKNNSYFYTSAALNTNLKKLFSIGDAISKSELRLSWAQAGNDAAPYNIQNTYGYGVPWSGNYSLVGPGTLLNKDLKSELTNTYEVGTAWGLFNNRLGIDFTYYEKRTKNQILALSQAQSSGATARVINAGEIKNNGIEVMLSATPVSRPNSFQWNVQLNLSHNVGKVVSLTDDVKEIVQSAPGEDASIRAKVGEKMGAIWGPGYQRVASGPMAGEIIIFSDGSPRQTSEDIYLGNLNPDLIAGLNNQFSYKGFHLNFLFAGQLGGKFISRFYNKAAGAGQLEESARGREARTPGSEYNDPYFIPGAAQMADGSYQANNTSTDGTYSTGVYGVTARDFIKKPLDHISEAQLFSATYVKLRELSLGYSLPANLLGRTFIKTAKISVTGRNLLLFTPKSNRHFDPEVATATGGSGLVPGFENMSIPSTREMGVSLNLNF